MEFPRRLLTVRGKGDKSTAHHRSKSVPPSGNNKRPFAADALRAIFKSDNNDNSKSNADDTTTHQREQEKEAFQVDQVQHRLDELNITNVSVEHIRAILATKYASGSALRAAEFIDIEQKSAAGVLQAYDPSVHLLGAVNRNAVSCYLDALLFAMFVRLDSFECILKNDYPSDDPRQRLVNLLRVWVNMLRSGRLIEVDLTEHILNAIADCGWEDARRTEQQDTSEAFAFLTETLQLPLLPLQVDLFHEGRHDEADSKVVHERLLNLAVPEESEGREIKLEDCLEEYFNTRVDVLRDSEVARKSVTQDALTPLTPGTPTAALRNTIRIVGPDTTEGSVMMSSSPVAMTPVTTYDHHDLFRSPSLPADVHMTNSTSAGGMSEPPEPNGESSSTNSPTQGEPHRNDLEKDVLHETKMREHLLRERALSQPLSNFGLPKASRPSTRQRSASVIQNVVLDDQGRPSNTEDQGIIAKAKRTGSTVVKAVALPAWQIFRIVPWHAVTKNEPSTDSEVAMNFDERPVVGICLKRYGMNARGEPIRRNTYIDIPISLRLPRFMLVEDDTRIEEESSGLSNYKLVLQSVICHRGQDLQSGHYFTYCRVAPRTLTENRRHDFDPPPDYEEAQWVKFDDLVEESRVAYVDDIKEALKVDMPYLLFYQVVPVVEMAPPSTEGTEAEPPSYDEARVSLEITGPDSDDPVFSRLPDGYFVGVESSIRRAPSSLDLEGALRKSTELISASGNPNSLAAGSRRPSVIFTDSNINTPGVTPVLTPAVTPDGNSPLITPADETTASRLSRAATRFAKGRTSRSGSQSGDNRMSLTMSRLSGLMRASKEPLADQPVTPGEAVALGNESPPSLESKPEEADMADTEKSMHITVEEPAAEPSKDTKHRHEHKHKHKRAKSKEKNKKAKESSQPERECTVM